MKSKYFDDSPLTATNSKLTRAERAMQLCDCTSTLNLNAYSNNDEPSKRLSPRRCNKQNIDRLYGNADSASVLHYGKCSQLVLSREEEHLKKRTLPIK